MRPLLAILALLGLAGIVFGVLIMIHGTNGHAAFNYENYGGPGPLIAGLIVLVACWYLLSSSKTPE
jgi:hypothetical protein